jgi:predicted O-methyltransferase YrrM
MSTTAPPNVDAADQRRGIKRSSPAVFVKDEHVRSCRLLPDRVALLRELPHHGIVAEIGAAFGDYTSEILAHNLPSTLHLVDMWSSERYTRGLEAIKQKHRDLIERGALHIHQGTSLEMLETFPDAYFDWVYIDTDHSYTTTAAELHLAASKVKHAGFIAGHDYCPGNVITPWPYGVIEACNEFCVKEGWQYRFLTVEPHGHNSFALSRL